MFWLNTTSQTLYFFAPWGVFTLNAKDTLDPKTNLSLLLSRGNILLKTFVLSSILETHVIYVGPNETDSDMLSVRYLGSG